MSERNPLEGIFEKAGELLKRLLPIVNEGKLESEKKYGGVLIACRTDGDETSVQATFPLGDVPRKDLQKYTKWALGKVTSLEENPDHVSSWQGRDPGKER